MPVKSVFGCAVLAFFWTVLLALGCSDSSGSSGGSAGAASSARGASSSGGSGAVEDPCRTAAPTDAVSLLQKLEGTYEFSARDEGCDFRGHTYVAPEAYQLSVDASSKSVKVSTSTGAELFALSWDDSNDVACKDEFSDTLVLRDGGDTVRVGFLNGRFSSVSFGQCWFVAN